MAGSRMGKVAANLESEIRKMYEVGGRPEWRFWRQRFLRRGEPGLRLNP